MVKRQPGDKAMDYLAWLVESNSADCAATCLVYGHLLIAENSITHSTQHTSQNYQHTITVMKYLAELMTADTKKLVYDDLLKKLLKQKIAGEMKGYLKTPFDDNEIDFIIACIFECFKDKSDYNKKSNNVFQGINFPELKKIVRHGEPELGAMLGVANQVLRYLDYLLKQSPDELQNAITSLHRRNITFSDYGGVSIVDAKWIRNRNSPGYGILAFSNFYKPKKQKRAKKEESAEKKGPLGSVHAETKIVDFLLASRMLTSKDKDTKFFIGISKRCCPDCEIALKSVNKATDNAIRVSGNHQIRAQENWLTPVFLFQEDMVEEEKNWYIKGLRHSATYPTSWGYYIRDGEIMPTNGEWDVEKDNQSEVFLHRDWELIEVIQKNFEQAKEILSSSKKKPLDRAQSHLSSGSETASSSDDEKRMASNTSIEALLGKAARSMAAIRERIETSDWTSTLREKNNLISSLNNIAQDANELKNLVNDNLSTESKKRTATPTLFYSNPDKKVKTDFDRKDDMEGTNTPPSSPS